MKTNKEIEVRYANAGKALIGYSENTNTECTVEKIIRFTEKQFADYLVKEFKHKLRFDHYTNKWYIWSGSYWKQDKVKEINDYYNICLEILLEDCSLQTDPEIKKKYYKFLCDCSGYNKLRNILNLAGSIEGIRITNDELDNKIYLYNCSNCTLDLSGKVPVRKEFNSNDNLTQITDVVYDPKAKANEFLKFMKTIFDNNEELINYLQRVLGYCLTGYTNEDAVFFMYGTGKNGKSTFIEIIKMIMGDYYKRINMESLIVKNNNSINNDIACLNNSRLVTASEIEAGKKLNESLIKDLAGGDEITARFLFKEYFTFSPKFKILMAGNHKPVIKGTDNGIKRRLKLIPFTVTISNEQTISRHEILKTMENEASGILNWILEGFVQWRKDGLQEPEIVTNATDDYFDEMDSLKPFIDECCVDIVSKSNDINKISVKNMYEKYVGFCETNKNEPMSKFMFDNKLKDKGYLTRPGNGNITYWTNIAIK